MCFLIFNQRCNPWDVSSLFFYACFILKSFNMLLANNECWPFEFCKKNWENALFPPTCIIIPLHTKAITKVVDPTSHHHIVVGCQVMFIASCQRSVLNMLVTKRRRREWKTMGIVTEFLCMVPHWLHWMCSLLCAHWYVLVISSWFSISLSKKISF